MYLPPPPPPPPPLPLSISPLPPPAQASGSSDCDPSVGNAHQPVLNQFHFNFKTSSPLSPFNKESKRRPPTMQPSSSSIVSIGSNQEPNSSALGVHRAPSKVSLNQKYHARTSTGSGSVRGHFEQTSPSSQTPHHHHHKCLKNARATPTKLANDKDRRGKETTKIKEKTFSHAHFDGSKKSRNVLMSQIYLIAHLSIALCLSSSSSSSLSSGNGLESRPLWQHLGSCFRGYIMIVSLGFFASLRCYLGPNAASNGKGEFSTSSSGPSTTPNSYCAANSEPRPLIWGACLLGLGQLILLASTMMTGACSQSEFIVWPVLKFIFTFFTIHFLLTQVIHSDHIGLRNMGLAHILATQLSLWINSLSQLSTSASHAHFPLEPMCNYTLDLNALQLVPQHHHHQQQQWPSITPNVFSMTEEWPLFHSILVILSHQFKLITCSLLVTMWFTNNQSKINFIRAKLSDEEVLRTVASHKQQGGGGGLEDGQRPTDELATGHHRGWLYGGCCLVFTFLVMIIDGSGHEWGETLMSSAKVIVNLLACIVCMVGVMRRGSRKHLNPKYQVNVLKHHHLPLVTLAVVYMLCCHRIVAQVTDHFHSQTTPAKNSSMDSFRFGLDLLVHLTTLLQTTVQACLIRLQAKKLVQMVNTFSLLAMVNLSLFCLDVWEQSSSSRTLQDGNGSSVQTVLPLFLALNRLYGTLISLHFWTMSV